MCLHKVSLWYSCFLGLEVVDGRRRKERWEMWGGEEVRRHA